MLRKSLTMELSRALNGKLNFTVACFMNVCNISGCRVIASYYTCVAT